MLYGNHNMYPIKEVAQSPVFLFESSEAAVKQQHQVMYWIEVNMQMHVPNNCGCHF